ncbi:hypothetical protein CISIN_1g0362322mg, partial [Citrus sinensis]
MLRRRERETSRRPLLFQRKKLKKGTTTRFNWVGGNTKDKSEIENSKLSSEVLREAVSTICGDAKEKNRNFVETIELQIGLKNYDPQKDKRFSGSVKLPHIPRPMMKVCMLGDAQHVEQ